VWYRTPALNVTIRQHWTKQQAEKKKAWLALLSALRATASDPSTPIHMREVLKTCSMALGTHAWYPTTISGKSDSRQSRFVALRSPKNEP
jgi:hypothetical protein